MKKKNMNLIVRVEDLIGMSFVKIWKGEMANENSRLALNIMF